MVLILKIKYIIDIEEFKNGAFLFDLFINFQSNLNLRQLYLLIPSNLV